jgi:putative beta-barrel porin BBP2
LARCALFGDDMGTPLPKRFVKKLYLLATVVLIVVARAQGASADGPVVDIVTAFSPTVVPLPADKDFTGNGLITGQFGKNNGPFEYAVHLTIRGAYDDNIGLTHANRLDDYFVQIQPSLMLGLGDVVKQDNFLAARYSPSFYRYDDHSDFNSDQHFVRVTGGIKSGDLIVRLIQDVALLNNIVLAASSGERSALGTNGRTDISIYNSRLSANYNMTPRDFLFTELKMNRYDYADPLVSSTLYATNLYLNHGFSQQLVLGAGVEGGFNEVGFPTPDQTMVQANGHLNFTPNNQFALDVIAGVEFRDFEDIARQSYSTPVFTISATFLPLDSTRIIFGATRQIYNSAAQTAQDYVDTNLTGTIRERLCNQLYLILLGGYEHVDYFNTIDSRMPLPTLRDDFWYVQPSVDLLLTRSCSVGGYYLRRQNSGSISTVAFYSNEYGVRMSIKF